MSEPFQKALADIRDNIMRKQDHPAHRTEEQRKMDRWKARMNLDPEGSMRLTERMLWAIHDQGRRLDTRDPAGVGGFQLYTWVAYMHAAKRTHEPIYRWVMADLDAAMTGRGLVKTSEGWLPIGAVAPSGQNASEPIDEIVDYEGQTTFVMGYKAVRSPDGRLRLAQPGESLDDDQEASVRPWQLEPEADGDADAAGEGDDGDLRDGDDVRVEQGDLWADAPDGEADDVGGRVLRAARRRLDGGGGSDRL